jgi:cytochrome d ubiquinol oxidase subunit I
MFTRDGVSPLVGPGLVLTSLVVLTLLYLLLAVVEVTLLVRYAKAGPPEDAAQLAAPIEAPERDAGLSDDDADADDRSERPLTFAY